MTLYAGTGSHSVGLTSEVKVNKIHDLGYGSADLYHFFGIFLPGHIWALQKVLRRPAVFSPMGQLMHYHLRRSGLRKRIYLWAVKPLLKQVTMFHAFAEPERQSLRHYLGPNVPTFAASLGVFPNPAATRLQVQRPFDKKLRILCFGRNDVYQKGLDILLEGFAQAVRNRASAELTIAGRPWNNSGRYIRKVVTQRRLSDVVQVVGPVDEGTKYQLLAQADYLVFLSRWDGPPRPIREAIAVGTPVIVSPETNMGCLVEEHHAGMQVQLDVNQVGEAIAELAANPELWRRHRDGVAQLRERLDWHRVAEDYIRGYEKALRESR